MICFWKPKTLYTYGAFGCTTKIMICCSLLCFLKIQFFKYLGITFTDQASMYNLNYQNLKVLNEDMIMILNLKMSKHRLYFLLFNQNLKYDQGFKSCGVGLSHFFMERNALPSHPVLILRTRMSQDMLIGTLGQCRDGPVLAHGMVSYPSILWDVSLGLESLIMTAYYCVFFQILVHCIFIFAIMRSMQI